MLVWSANTNFLPCLLASCAAAPGNIDDVTDALLRCPHETFATNILTSTLSTALRDTKLAEVGGTFLYSTCAVPLQQRALQTNILTSMLSAALWDTKLAEVGSTFQYLHVQYIPCTFVIPVQHM